MLAIFQHLRRRRRLFISLVSLLVLLSLVAVLPVQTDSNEELFVIPKGTWSRRMNGENLAILPDTIYLTLGVKNWLVLKNDDDVPQIFGPTLIMPGQRFKLPFETESENQFICTAHASGQMTVIVAAEPTPGWPRLRWRLSNWYRQLKR